MLRPPQYAIPTPPGGGVESTREGQTLRGYGEVRRGGVQLEAGDSLFDRHRAEGLVENLAYMSRTYGFFVPFVENVAVRVPRTHAQTHAQGQRAHGQDSRGWGGEGMGWGDGPAARAAGGTSAGPVRVADCGGVLRRGGGWEMQLAGGACRVARGGREEGLEG